MKIKMFNIVIMCMLLSACQSTSLGTNNKYSFWSKLPDVNISDWPSKNEDIKDHKNEEENTPTPAYTSLQPGFYRDNNNFSSIFTLGYYFYDDGTFDSYTVPFPSPPSDNGTWKMQEDGSVMITSQTQNTSKKGIVANNQQNVIVIDDVKFTAMPMPQLFIDDKPLYLDYYNILADYLSDDIQIHTFGDGAELIVFYYPGNLTSIELHNLSYDPEQGIYKVDSPYKNGNLTQNDAILISTQISEGIPAQSISFTTNQGTYLEYMIAYNGINGHIILVP